MKRNPSDNQYMYDVFKVWYSFYRDDSPNWEVQYKNTLIKFLGGYEGHLGVLGTWRLTPEAEQRAEMLLSPHARTIVTAYFLQHPELIPPPLLNVPSVEVS